MLRVALALLLAVLAFTPGADAYFDVSKLPLPPVTGQEIAANVESFSTTYAPRATGTPQEQAAGEFLRAEAEALGYQTEIVALPVAGGEPSSTLRAVVATKQGVTKPDEHILFMGHYDTVAGYGGATVNGAYDNGSGTTMIRALAKSFANVPTNRTLDFVWYNGEEEDVLASQRHAQMWKDSGKAVRAVLGFDMTGIAWPVGNLTARSCLCMWHGDEDEPMAELLRYVNYDVLGYPEAENLVHIVGINERNSDEASWDRQGYTILRWAGMRAAADYPAYHRFDDTMATIESVAGGRSFFEQGLRNTLVSAYLTALTLDNEPPVARASARGDRRIVFDATASSDPDGAVGTVTWDYGDGARGRGARATHSYKKAGDYVATATVHDNLWSQVTASVPVIVHTSGAPATHKVSRRCALRRKRGESRRHFRKRVARCRRAARRRTR